MTNDDDIWHQEIKTVKPLKNKKPIVMPTIKVKKPVVKPYDQVPPVLEKMAQRPMASPLPQQRLKQLRQQKIPVEASIDLHGYTIEKAHITLQNFFYRAVRNQLKCIEIITGRGDPIRGTGQLRRLVPIWLNEPLIRQAIVHIEENQHTRGGSLLVLLRRNKGE
jgi:DNA-nicking Smr family endonuclease